MFKILMSVLCTLRLLKFKKKKLIVPSKTHLLDALERIVSVVSWGDQAPTCFTVETHGSALLIHSHLMAFSEASVKDLMAIFLAGGTSAVFPGQPEAANQGLCEGGLLVSVDVHRVSLRSDDGDSLLWSVIQLPSVPGHGSNDNDHQPGPLDSC